MATATKKKRSEEAYPWKAGASSGHTTNLKQSILRLLISMNHNMDYYKLVNQWLFWELTLVLVK
jgi:hypothetical protein